MSFPPQTLLFSFATFKRKEKYDCDMYEKRISAKIVDLKITIVF